jgi:hypothetical protein
MSTIGEYEARIRELRQRDLDIADNETYLFTLMRTRTDLNERHYEVGLQRPRRYALTAYNTQRPRRYAVTAYDTLTGHIAEIGQEILDVYNRVRRLRTTVPGIADGIEDIRVSIANAIRTARRAIAASLRGRSMLTGRKRKRGE